MSESEKMRPRILIARPDHLGDVLLTLPAVAALRRAFPDAHISFLVPTGLSDIPGHCPDIDDVCTLSLPPLTDPLDERRWAATTAKEAEALRGRFDLAILARPDDPWMGPLIRAAEIPIRVGYALPCTKPFLTKAIPFHGNWHAAIQSLNLAKAAADCLGVTIDDRLWKPSPIRFEPSASEEAMIEELIGESHANGTHPVVMHPGSSWPLKHWSPQRWGELAIRMRQLWDVTPLVTGGPSEESLMHSVVEASRGCAYSLPGWLSVGSLAALYRRSPLVIAIDSGPLHLAAMIGVPVIGLYGPMDPLKFGPWCCPDRCRMIHIQLPCSPCGHLFDPPCGVPIDPPCTAGITVEAIIAAAADLLGRGEFDMALCEQTEKSKR